MKFELIGYEKVSFNFNDGKVFNGMRLYGAVESKNPNLEGIATDTYTINTDGDFYNSVMMPKLELGKHYYVAFNKGGKSVSMLVESI